MSVKSVVLWCVVGVAGLFLLVLGLNCVKTVEAGYVSVATYFGDVQDNVYTEGMTFPVNPLLCFSDYDVREKALDVPKIPMPTRDQQTSFIDVSVIYNINATACPAAKSDVGMAADIVNVKVAPNLRSLLRSEGKAVSRCEDLFSETVQETMQANLQTNLQARVGKYATIKAVLIRNIELPKHILDAIKNKKVREQQAEEQKAKLLQFKTEMEEKEVQAAAEKAAAKEKAEQVRILADAQAYEITKITEAIADSPAYIQLEALKTLGEISKDPASKMYFMDGKSTMPLPLLHMGDSVSNTK